MHHHAHVQREPEKHLHVSSRAKAAFLVGLGAGISVFAFGGICVLSLIFILNPEKKFITNAPSAPVVTATAPEAQIDSIDTATLRHVRGSGAVTFIAYSDLECPVCKTFEPVIAAAREKFDGRVAFAYKHYPLPQHSKAKRESLAAECAGEQGKFFEFVDRMFEITPSNNELEDQRLFDTARELELNMDTFTGCLNSEKYLANVLQDAREAAQTGATGAPHEVVIDADGTIIRTITGRVTQEQLFQVLEEALPHE